MPIFTFRCPKCGAEKEVICKASERDSQAEPCPVGCSVMCDRPVLLQWAGVEGGQHHRLNGKYRIKLRGADGSLTRPDNTRGRSDS